MNKILIFFLLISLYSCESKQLVKDDLLYGISFNSPNKPPYNSDADSLISINLTTKICSNIASVNKFANLSDIYMKTRSIKKNLFIFKGLDASSDIGLIDLNNMNINHISLNDSALVQVLAIHIDEIENMLYAIAIKFDKKNQTDSLGIIPINLVTKEILPIINFKSLRPFISTFQFFSDIDFNNKRIFIKTAEKDELNIFNYKTRVLQTKAFSWESIDFHYNVNKDCLFGVGSLNNKFCLFEYSIKDNVLKNTGSFQSVDAINTKGFFYDKVKNLYFISAYLNGSKLIKINLSNASIEDTISLSKNISYIN